jgi:hypothetical protein
MIWSIAQTDSALPSDCPDNNAVKIVGQVSSPPADGMAVIG